MKKYCFEVTFENVSLGYIIADTWGEAVAAVLRIRENKYPEMKDQEEDIVQIKLLGLSVGATY